MYPTNLYKFKYFEFYNEIKEKKKRIFYVDLEFEVLQQIYQAN